MKKVFVAVLTLFIISGCTSQKNKSIYDNKTQVYSFYVDGHDIEINNGVIVIGPDNQIFSGGRLEINKKIDTKITYIKKRFYIQKQDIKETIVTSETSCEDGFPLEMNLFLPDKTGDMFHDFDSIYDNLYFELELTFENREISTFTTALNVKEITKISE